MVELRLPRALQSRLALRGRMARASGGRHWRPGPGNPAGLQRARPRGSPARALAAGRSLAGRCTVALAFLLAAASAQAQIVSTRIWPARDYTRVTLESAAEIKYQLFAVKNPERLVLDIEGVDLSAALAELHGKVATGDPYIDKLRVGRNRPGVMRL